MDKIYYEYGIVHIRSFEQYREHMTLESANNFMDPEGWDGVDPTKIFKIVRRTIGIWEDYKNE